MSQVRNLVVVLLARSKSNPQKGTQERRTPRNCECVFVHSPRVFRTLFGEDLSIVMG